MRVTCPPEHEISIWIRELSPDVVYLSLSYFNDPRYKYAVDNVTFSVDGELELHIRQDNYGADPDDYWKVSIFPESVEEKRLLNVAFESLRFYSRSKETEQFVFISRSRMIESMGEGFFWDNWSNEKETV